MAGYATTIPRHEDRILRDVKANFLALRGGKDYARRVAEIEALATVEWRGRTLFTIRCHGDYGKGPHDVNVPESLLWNLIGVDHYRCPFHTR